MSGLETLGRLYDWKLDEARRALGRLNAALASLGAERARLARSAEREAGAAGEDGSLEAARSYSAYLAAVLARRRALDEEIGALGPEIAAAENAVAEAQRDSKACQAALERIAAERAIAERRRQQTLQDEAGRRMVAKGTLPDL